MKITQQDFFDNILQRQFSTTSQKQPSKSDEDKSNENINLSNFVLMRVLGQTHSCQLAIFRDKNTTKLYQLKIIKKSPQNNSLGSSFKAIENCLTGLEHQFILPLMHAWETKNRVYFALDYCSGGDLGNLLLKKKTFIEEQARFFAAQILLALEYIHKNRIIFQDLKMENILLDSRGYVRLTDFSVKKSNYYSKSSNIIYSIMNEYLAPEVLANAKITKSTDWWSFGCLIYEMLTGLPPFFSNSQEEMEIKLINYDLKMPNTLSDIAQDLIKKLLDPNPTQRLGSKNGSREIQDHPWFRSVNWVGLLKKSVTPPFLPCIKKEFDLLSDETEYTETPKSTFKESLESQPSSFDYSNHKNLEGSLKIFSDKSYFIMNEEFI